MRFTGTFTALITPFNSDYSVDYKGLETIVEFQIQQGISGLVALGTTAETPTLTDVEQGKIVELVLKKVAGRVPVVVGTGSNSTARTIASTKRAQEVGAAGALIVAPYYNKPTQEGLYLHYRAISEALDFPVMIYNIKGRTAVNIETSTLKRIAELPNMICVKEATGDINQISDVINEIQNQKTNFTVLSGDDGLTFPILALGGQGLVSVASNLIPGQVSKMVKLSLAGEFKAARELHFQLAELFKVIFVETNPAPIKVAMELAGLPGGPVRLPLAPLKSQNVDLLKSAITKLGLIK